MLDSGRRLATFFSLATILGVYFETAFGQLAVCDWAPTDPEPKQNESDGIHWGADADAAGPGGYYRMSRFVLNATGEPRRITWPLGRIQALNLQDGQFAVHCSDVVRNYHPVDGPLFHLRYPRGIPTTVYEGEYEPTDYSQTARRTIQTTFLISAPKQSFESIIPDVKPNTKVRVTTSVVFEKESYRVTYQIENLGRNTVFLSIADVPPSARPSDELIVVSPDNPWSTTIYTDAYPTPVWTPVGIIDADGQLQGRFEAQSVIVRTGWRR